MSSGDKTKITVMVCANATGNVLPPYILFKGERENEALKATIPTDWKMRLTPKGWMDADSFTYWLKQVFLPYVEKVRREETEEVELLLDGHRSHEGLEAVQFAKENNITIFCLPPHLTHLLQPLDVSFFRLM